MQRTNRQKEEERGGVGRNEMEELKHKETKKLHTRKRRCRVLTKKCRTEQGGKAQERLERELMRGEQSKEGQSLYEK